MSGKFKPSDSVKDKEMILKQLEIEKKQLEEAVLEKKKEAMERSEKLYNLKWKTKRAEFAIYYEDKEKENERQRVKTLNESIDVAEEKWSGVETQFELSEGNVKLLTREMNEIEEELKHLNDSNQKNETTLVELKQSVEVLKHRNAAMMLKLKKQKQEFDEQIQRYSSRLSEK